MILIKQRTPEDLREVMWNMLTSRLCGIGKIPLVPQIKCIYLKCSTELAKETKKRG